MTLSERAVPSFALEHFIRRAKEYRALITDGRWDRIPKMWKSWKDHKTQEFYEKHGGKAIIIASGRLRSPVRSSQALSAVSFTAPRVPPTAHPAMRSSHPHTQCKPAFTARPTTPTTRQ